MYDSLFTYKFVDVNKKKEQYKIAYIDLDPHNSDEILLCIHGVTRNCRDFDYLAKHILQNTNYRVILVDIVGRGKSDWLINKADYQYSEHVKDVVFFLKHLNINKLSILGTSMGGMLTMELVAKHPEMVKKIILNDVGPFVAYADRRYILDRVLVYPSFNTIDKAREFLRKYFDAIEKFNDEHLEHILKYQLIYSEKTNVFSFVYDNSITANLDEELNRTKKNFEAWDLWEKIKVPVLLIRGARSKMLSMDTVEKMMHNKNNVDYVDFPGCGHAPFLFKEEQIVPIVNWLQKHS